jgi:CRP-like cAMP-binding protein
MGHSTHASRGGTWSSDSGTPPRNLDDLLGGSVWYPALSAAARRVVRDTIREVGVPIGKPLCMQGDIPRHWYGTVDGLLKWTVSRSDGRSVTLGGLSTGSWFGEGTLMQASARTASIIALRPSRVALIPAETFFHLRETEPTFSDFLLKQVNERMLWFMGNFAAYHLLDTNGNVARALAGLFHPWLHPRSDPHLRVSQEEIANLSGLSRQRCNGALRELADEGLIEIGYGGIIVVDVDGLRSRMQIR